MVRHARSFVVALAVLMVAAAFSIVHVSPASAASDPTAIEAQFFALLNHERVDAGLPALASDTGLDSLARAWSGQLRSEGALRHRPDLAAAIGAIEPRWTRGGENVGVGGEVQALHDAFMNSPAHRDNVMGAFTRMGVGAVVEDSGRIWVTFNFVEAPVPATGPSAPPVAASGPTGDLWLTTAAGDVRAMGSAPELGDLGGQPLNQPIVGMASTPSGRGYWLVASDGGIFAFGDAQFHGSTGAVRLNKPIVGMAGTESGRGYWLVASDGGIFAFGDAQFHGSTGAVRLNKPIVGMAGTESGHGYWLVASDGGIFAFGDAQFHGSTAAHPGAVAVNGIATTPSGNGYWIVDSAGGVAAFGDAPFLGSAAGLGGRATFSRIAPTSDGQGYRLATTDGRVFNFGSAGTGATAPLDTTSPVVAVANQA